MRMMKKTMVGFGVALLVVAASATKSEAVSINLSDQNSSATIDDTGTYDGSDPARIGMVNWTVDGQNQLYQQWFWFRIGSGADAPINSMTSLGSLATDTFLSSPGLDTATMAWANANLQVNVTYTLAGNSLLSDQSHLNEVITIKNLSTSALDLHFFQYSDFDLNGTIGDDTVEVGPGSLGTNTVVQTDPALAGAELSETVTSPGPDHYEVNTWANTRNSLNDGAPTTLNDNAGALTGDVTWAFQWDRTLNPGESLNISKDKRVNPIPEPASLLLFGLGLIGTAGAARRRKAMAPEV